MTITLTVAGRIATVEADGHVVAGNTYPVTLSLDSEWTGNLYLRVRFGSLYYDIPFASSVASVDVQMPVGYPEVGIGVFSEALEICTNEARVRLLRSILEAGEQVVEFDSDLYDQWAGEVTTLLTDDAFDAESTRPVQNAVITAWKDTVPLDSAVVHRNGNETVNGTKTLTNNPVITGITPSLYFQSTAVSTASAWRGLYRVTDKKNGANDTFFEMRLVGGDGTTRNSMEIALANPDRSTTVGIALQNYGDHAQIVMPTYYPVDGQGNPLALANNLVMASGNIAVDPRLVHTTGTESIAGDKTLSGTFSLARADPTVNFKSSTTTEQTGVKANIVFYTNNTVRGQVFQQRDASTEFIALRQQKLVGSGFSELRLRVDSNDVGWAECPSYTADNSADGKIVTRSMLAQTPTVVHTTGAETIAGNKTFSGTTTSDGNMRVNGTFSLLPAFVAGMTGWIRLYEITPHHNSGAVRFTADSAVSMAHPSEIAMYLAGSAASMSLTAYNNEFGVELIAARRASDKHVEIWGRKTWASWQCVFRYRHNVVVGDLTESATAPAVGDTYDMIATL